MSLTINPINSNNYKPAFGAKVSTKAALQILSGTYPPEDTSKIKKACMAIAGPETFIRGISSVIERCSQALRNQFPNLEQKAASFGNEINVKALYNEEDIEILSLMRRMNKAEEANSKDYGQYGPGYIFRTSDQKGSLGDLWAEFKARKGL